MHSMTERICMSSSKATQKVVFSLIDKDDTDILSVDMSECGMSEKEIRLNDGPQCQADLKDVFLTLIQAMTTSEIEIVFDDDEEYPRELIHSAMKAYVEDLSNEVQAVAAELDSELSELEEDTQDPDESSQAVM